MFTQAEVTCPFCHAKRNGIVPTFSCSISWKDAGWVDLKTALAQAQPFLGYLPKGWHLDGCSREDQCPKVTKLGKWLYLELRPYPSLRNDFFPFLSESVPLFSDDSLCAEGLCVDSLVCSNLSAGERRHYWLVEIIGGRIQHAYDSLQGVQLLTQEVYRMLQVTGILLRAESSGKPSLRNPKLDQMAGKVETVQRRSQAIRVPSRSRTCKMRKQLVKSMSNLSFAPTKLNLFSKHYEEKKEGFVENVQYSLRRATSGHHKALGGYKGSKAHRAGKAKGRAKGRARPKNTQKNTLVSCKTLKNGIVSHECSSLGINNKQDEGVHHGSENFDGATKAVESASQEAPHPNGTMKLIGTEGNASELAVASDPISDTFTQIGEPVVSPLREEKRSFAHARLDETSQGDGTEDDDLRRKHGPPRVSPGMHKEEIVGVAPRSIEGHRPPHLIGHEPGKEVPLQNPEVERLSPPVVEQTCVSQEVEREVHLSKPRTARCRALPVTGVGGCNKGVPREEESVNAPAVGRYGVISLFDGVSTVMPILKKKFGYPPVAAILAECDLSLRELVCTEFGYRSDEKWGYTQDGSAVLYLKDVHAIIKGNCQLLKELVRMFPDCKWVIVGGSPCQDLTFAGPLRGVLGLIGPVGPAAAVTDILLTRCCIYTLTPSVSCLAFLWTSTGAMSGILGILVFRSLGDGTFFATTMTLRILNSLC